ncbi:MAG: hypothetical protein JW913_09875 [Chitinispirillaceae bacterium]|nr:hypothetical protein [Chitinispirillaceae bacterium]
MQRSKWSRKIGSTATMSKKTKRSAGRRGMRTLMRQRRSGIKNELYGTMVRFARACGAYDEFMRLPPLEHAFLKKLQFMSVRIRAEKESGIGNQIVAAVKKDLSNYLRSQKIDLDGSDEEFTMYDLITAGQTLWQAARCNTEEPKWKDVLGRLGPLIRHFEDREEFLHGKIIFDFLQGIIDIVSRLDKYFIWFTMGMEYVGRNFATVYTIHRQSCIRKKVAVDGRPRPAYRVGRALWVDGVKWAAVKGELLVPFCKADPGREYPVFVQSHALERLKERLFPVPVDDILFDISFGLPEISRGPAEKLFFSVRRANCKLGYLLTDLIGDELIVRSFLFITNTGTDEGRKYNERLRVETYSKKYFGLDSLLTYISTDICVDPFFRSVLTDCGCEGLVRFKEFFSEIESDNTFSANLRRELALEEEVGKSDETSALKPSFH